MQKIPSLVVILTAPDWLITRRSTKHDTVLAATKVPVHNMAGFIL